MSKLTSLTVTLLLTSVLTSLLVTSGEASKKHNWTIECGSKIECKNGGVCKLYGDVSKCDCPGTGRTKEHCIDVCKLRAGVFKCDCAGTGYNGDKCTKKISAMVTKPPCTVPCMNIVSPCFSAKCPRFPNAKCRSNYCNGCNYEFWLDGVDVTSDCDAGVLPVPDLCALPAFPGPCKSSVPRHYYDTKKHECVRFLYGWCDGNDNNFKTMEGCRNTCEKGICSLPPDEGNCRASITMYHYNMKTGKCEMFDYGGCGGNENQFESEEECREACDPLYSHRDPSWRAGKHEV